MQFHPGRILGIIMGLVILATIFLIPFDANNTLYGIVGPDISNLGSLQQTLGAAALTNAYVWIIAFILLVIAGVVGLFPLGTGVLGVVGMAMITVSPYLIYPAGPGLPSGPGFYVVWVASIIALGASFWHGKKKMTPATAPVSVTVTQTQTVGGAATTTPQSTAGTTSTTKTVKCPNCGMENPAAAFKCSNCGKNLTQGTAS